MFSIVIITKNEGHILQKTLEAAKDLTDDLVIIDGFSEDNTVEIARSFGANVVSNEWLGYSATKNLGNNIAKHDWILSLDADEVLNEEATSALKQLIPENNRVYAFNRLNYYCGTFVKHGGWFPQWIPRLFNKNEHRWNSNLVHEELDGLSKSKSVRLDGLILHYSYFKESQHLVKIDKYAKYRAEEWIQQGRKPSILKRYFGPELRFLRNYVWLFGFLDGKAGYSIAKYEAKMISLQCDWYDRLIKS